MLVGVGSPPPGRRNGLVGSTHHIQCLRARCVSGGRGRGRDKRADARLPGFLALQQFAPRLREPLPEHGLGVGNSFDARMHMRAGLEARAGRVPDLAGAVVSAGRHKQTREHASERGAGRHGCAARPLRFIYR